MNIYFAGIGGVGIGPLAEIALDAGYTVSGSDPAEGLMTAQLRQRGVTISTVQDGMFLRTSHASTPIDRVVYTAALAPNHPELATAAELGITVMKRDAFLAEIIADHGLQLIAVAGTHGKTTTTGMLIWCLQQMGVPISYSIGTTISFGQSGVFTKGSRYFIYECDEFDRNFLHFSPSLSLITSVDYDHSDTYPTRESYKQAFRQFLTQSDGAIMWQRDADYLGIEAHRGVWCLQDDEQAHLSLAGEHNRRNATLVAKTLDRLGLQAPIDAKQTLEQFPGTNRRFECLGDNLYTDYGHHPVEIAATLQLARELSDHVVLVYQPHQNTRQHEIIDEYLDCMDLAEEIYWLPTYLSREDPTLPILSPKDLTRSLTNSRSVQYADLDDALWNTISTARRNGKLVVCMGAGTIDDWVRERAVTAQP